MSKNDNKVKIKFTSVDNLVSNSRILDSKQLPETAKIKSNIIYNDGQK